MAPVAAEARLLAALVETQVRDLEQEFRRAPVRRVGGDPVVHSQREPRAPGKRRGGDLEADPLSDREGGEEVGVGKHHDEFVASPAAPRVHDPQELPDDARGAHQDRVADRVPETIVDPLEVLQVRHEDRHDAVRALGAGDLAPQVLEQETTVVEPGQRIRDRVDPQDREVPVGEEARFLEQPLAAVEVVKERRLEADGRAESFAQGFQDRLDLLPPFLRFPAAVRQTRPVEQELAEDFLLILVAGELIQGLAETGHREVPLPSQAGKLADSPADLSLIQALSVLPVKPG